MFDWTTDNVTAARAGKACLACLAALPLAAVQQVIFSGYLPSTMRDRHRLPIAVIVPSLLFGVCGGMAVRAGLLSPKGAGLRSA